VSSFDSAREISGRIHVDDGRSFGGAYSDGGRPPMRSTRSAMDAHQPHSRHEVCSQSVSEIRRRNPFGNARLSIVTSAIR